MLNRTNRFLVKRACYGCTYYVIFLLIVFTMFAYGMRHNNWELEHKMMAYYMVYLFVLTPLFTAALHPIRFIKRRISAREYFWIIITCLIIDETVRAINHDMSSFVIPVLYIPVIYYCMRWFVKYVYHYR